MTSAVVHQVRFPLKKKECNQANLKRRNFIESHTPMIPCTAPTRRNYYTCLRRYHTCHDTGTACHCPASFHMNSLTQKMFIGVCVRARTIVPLILLHVHRMVSLHIVRLSHRFRRRLLLLLFVKVFSDMTVHGLVKRTNLEWGASVTSVPSVAAILREDASGSISLFISLHLSHSILSPPSLPPSF